MTVDLERFKAEYPRWVEQSLVAYRAGDMKDIIKRYPFVVSEGIPWAPFRGSLSTKKVAVVTTGGLYLKGSQTPFDTESIHGDPSFRLLPKKIRQEDMGIAHAHFDHSLAERDLNVIFPMERLLELEEERIIGKLADTHYSFSYVNDVVPLVEEAVPSLISRLRGGAVDALLLVPV